MKNRGDKSAMGLVTILMLTIFFSSCTIAQDSLQEGDFGAYYTRIITGADWEMFDRTGDFPDIVIDLGSAKGKFVFWRGTSYLPYWENPSGEKFFVEEIIPRQGNGNDMMPDKVNTYSHVSLIESSGTEATVHWRYLPDFGGTNPHTGVVANQFVDEYFTVTSNGEVTRLIKTGTEKIDAWNDPANKITQTFMLSQRGIVEKETIAATINGEAETIKGNSIIEETIVEPLAWFHFDEARGDLTHESLGNKASTIPGDKTIWKKGVSGTALQFDGYKTAVQIPSGEALKPVDEITLEGWVAIGAYPWSWCPIVQQADDVPEEVRLFRGKYDITDLDKREGDLSIGLVGGDPDNQEGDVDVEQEIDFDEIEFMVKYQKEDDTGYFLGINGHGHPGFKIRVGGVWEELTSDVFLERKKWYHIAVTYSQSSGKMLLFVDGEKTDEKQVAKAEIELSLKD
ncbi:MAG: hypothetical protein KAS29_10010, partial [Bacteroidales bacterium]|nr:hypothetical protein [Bacteroidales bacterium]